MSTSHFVVVTLGIGGALAAWQGCGPSSGGNDPASSSKAVAASSSATGTGGGGAGGGGAPMQMGATVRISAEGVQGYHPSLIATDSGWAVAYTQEDPGAYQTYYTPISAAGVPGASIKIGAGSEPSLENDGGQIAVAVRATYHDPGFDSDTSQVFFANVVNGMLGKLARATRLKLSAGPAFDIARFGNAWWIAGCYESGGGGNLKLFATQVQTEPAALTPDLATEPCNQTQLRLLAGQQGLWLVYSADASGKPAVFLRAIDGKGVAVGNPVRVSPTGDVASDPVAWIDASGGITIVYDSTTTGPTLARFDADGKPKAAPKALELGGGISTGIHGAERHATGLAQIWNPDPNSPNAFGLSLRAHDTDGKPLGAPGALQTGMYVADYTPQLADHGTDVGAAWVDAPPDKKGGVYFARASGL